MTGEPPSGQRNGFRLATYRIGRCDQKKKISLGNSRLAGSVPQVEQLAVCVLVGLTIVRLCHVVCEDTLTVRA